jgi:DNA-binding beta-propeller fold protein YncE
MNDKPSSASWALCGLVAVAALAVPAAALGAPAARSGSSSAIGTLSQLSGQSGCLVDRGTARRGCTPVRALRGPAPFLGSDAIAISPDGKNLYVASSRSSAIAVFKRNRHTGKLSQRSGPAGCAAAGSAHGCAPAVGLEGPNSVAVSADGQNVYATSVDSDAVAIFSRDPSTGALTQATDGTGCIANAATAGCTEGRALDGADVIAVSPDGANVYVGAFFGNAVAVFDRDASTGALTQPADDTGCLVAAPASGCTTALALDAPEGMAISGDGNNVYVATAVSNALLVLARDPSTGALDQATDGSGCIVDAPLTGCTTGIQLAGANAVAVSPDDANVYVTSLISNSVTGFARTLGTGELTQLSGTSACAIYVLAVGCSLGRSLSAPEGIAASPDGASVYAAAFESNAIDVFNRNTQSGGLIQKSNRRGCVTTSKTPDCARARVLKEVSSVAVSANGRYLYSAAFASNAVGVFKRVTVGR